MATIAEIASRLNLNKSTVSRALNHRPGSMSEETRREILRAAQELGYAPNPAARALTSGRSGNIGLVSRKFNNALYTAILLELAIAVDAQGGNLVACITDRNTEHHGQAHLLHTGTVDGILAFPYALPGLNTPASPWMRGPIVFLLSAWEEKKAPSARFDDAEGAAQAARHLWELGHRRLLFLQGLGPRNESSFLSAERLAFLRANWTALGGQGERDVQDMAAQATAEGGYRAMTTVLTDGLKQITAILAYNDQMAFGALRALHERGIRVPQDVSLVGWNDLEETGEYTFPPLTSVRTSPRALALAALQLLQQQWETKNVPTPEDPQRIRVPVELIVRCSTGPPPVQK